LENSPSKVAATDQAFRHFISMEAVVRAESLACAGAVDDEADARQGLECRPDRSAGIVIMRPGHAAAKLDRGIRESARRRLAAIRKDLENAGPNYPREEVRAALAYWKIEL
jgi:hypothetical protein